MNRALLCIGCLGLLAGAQLAADDKKPDLSKLPPAAKEKIDFARDIQPIFASKCVSCHSAAKDRAGLRLDCGPEALKGSISGEVIIPGKSADSMLIHLVAGLDPDKRMPDKGDPLTAKEVGLLRAWIDQGAKWPEGLVIEVKKSPKLTHWAFQPIKRPDAPEVAKRDWVRNGIDAFVLARLEKEKIAPSPEADRVTLIRRLSLDLLGLPPTPQEVDEFLRDTRPDAYERLVDRLLASPHYGERWGRHWLDMARYADSDGFEKDTGRPFAWRYRHWVIDALNRDMPFDQFTIEQLAGDLLPNATTEQKIATGFHRNTLTNNEGGVDKEQFRVEAVVDRVNTTGKVFLGVTIGCAQCHDHKYDPFTQKEYYQFFAFFDSDNEVNIPAPLSKEETEAYEKKKAEHDKKKTELQAAANKYSKEELPAALQKWEAELKVPELRKLPANIRAILLIEPENRNEKQKKELTGYYSKVDKKLVELNKAVTDHQKKAPTLTQAQTLALGSPRKTHVMIRGDFLRPGVEVQPGTPGSLPAMNMGDKKTRLELAQWIVNPENPLTARVAVNWIWQRYFGRGLVPTLEDFGTQGERPSNPELLDWLALELMHQKWSLKGLHKTIVTSATYRQSSKIRPELVARDPNNILLARQSRLRLEAEIIRDLALASSGLLNKKIGGPSVCPPQPAGISELTYANSAKWVESTGADRYRRGMYTWFQRTSPYPMLMTFDAPDSNVCCVRRERSNTPLQALTLLNDTTFVECAQALARRIVDEGNGSTEERLRHGFRVCLAREPSQREMEILSRLFNELHEECKAKPETVAKLLGKTKMEKLDASEAAAWVALARALLNLDEFITRE